YPQRNQLKYTKKQYRVRNRREYEAGLCKRGDLAIWFSEDAFATGIRRWAQNPVANAATQTRPLRRP
ncbi:MAG: hypothetical protein WD672_01750, partial [Woeseia sp.]